MKCNNCEKSIRRGIKLIRNGKIQNTKFCTYECYLEFWKGVNGFIPLPKYKGGKHDK